MQFRNVADSAGLKFVVNNHPTPRKHMIETMPGGVATFDYDNDGLADIYFTNGAAIPSLEKSDPKYWNRLYRNEGGMKFRDVTAEAGVAGAGYSMGVAVADFDNDGDVDIFVAGVRRNLLFRNDGKGKFAEVGSAAGIKSDKWAVASGWFDYDRDGRLDLFVVNYAEWTPAFDRFCGDSAKNLRLYCHPKYFTGLPNSLYRNRGDGTFEDVTKKSGIGDHIGRGMSVAFADYDGDGFIDAFVTNDNLANFLFRNRGDGTFEETALLAGVALLDHGKPVASMGADFADYDNDGLFDISVTALAGETFPLFRNTSKGMFRDATFSTKMAALTSPRSGWGNGFFDFNNDGWKDLFTANSHVNDIIEQFEATQYRLPNSLFLNAGDGTFRDVSREAGFTESHAHRGSAFADFNNDGRVDIVVTSLGEAAELWQNVTEAAGNWLIVRLHGVKSNRDGIGARIRIGTQHGQMTSAVSYASSSHFGVHFGLGSAKKADSIEVRWPSGKLQTLSGVEANRIVDIREQQ